jgi:Spy/CpxP family protein refolding chaperone
VKLIYPSLLMAVVLTMSQVPFAFSETTWVNPIHETNLLSQAIEGSSNGMDKSNWHGKRHGHKGEFFKELNLSEAQKTQMKALFQSKRQEHQGFRQEFESILTADQKAQLKTMKEQAKSDKGQFKRGQFFKELNLSADQKEKLKAARQARMKEREAFHQEMMTILTPAQQEKFKSLMAEKKERMHKRFKGQNASQS